MRSRRTLLIDARMMRSLVTMKEAIGATERVFRSLALGKVQMPPKLYITLDKYHGDFRAMPGYVEDLGVCGLKWVCVYPENRKRGLPSVMAIIILADARDGFPLSIMEGTYLTALRTGAAGAVAAKYLARRNSRNLALIGCGVQAEMQLRGLREIFDIKQVTVWGLRHGEAAAFARRMSKAGNWTIRPLNTIEACIKEMDIVVTTTPSRKPLVRPDWLAPGVHINAIGADAKGKQELDSRIVQHARIVVDDWEQASHGGEINVPISRGELSRKDVYADIGEIVSRKKKGRTGARQTTVFDSTGLAIQDVAIASLAYRKAVKLGKGQPFTML